MNDNVNLGKGRILALDLGKKRIGLALSDPLGITAQGLQTLQRTRIREDLAALQRIAEENNVGLLLLGHPLHMSGHEGRQADNAREFGERLSAYTGLPVRLWDERLTSVEAGRILRDSGISIAKRARAVDKLAAQILLESFLDGGGDQFNSPGGDAWDENGGRAGEGTNGGSGMTRARQSVLLVCGLAAGVVGLAVASLYTLKQSPPIGGSGEIFLTFERGSRTSAMGQALADAGVILAPWQFTLMRVLSPSAKLQAGEYRFAQPASVYEVYTRIARGDVDFVPFTVPEGSNIFDIAALLDASGVVSGDEFLRAASDPTPIKDLAPTAVTQEGYLFPATYRLSHSTTARSLCDLMTAQFRKQWKRLVETSQSPAHTEDPPDLHSLVTMASLVERETSVAEERPLVAGVFTNRIRQRMRLDCDATTIYAALLDHRYRGAIHRSDLDSHNPYNTYQNDGLPPGPIANPGRQALAAALHPAKTDYLFFVAKPGGGGHQFSSTLAAHSKAVSDYRRGN